MVVAFGWYAIEGVQTGKGDYDMQLLYHDHGSYGRGARRQHEAFSAQQRMCSISLSDSPHFSEAEGKTNDGW